MAQAPDRAAVSILGVHCVSGGTAVPQGKAAGPLPGMSSAALTHFSPAPGPAAVIRHGWGEMGCPCVKATYHGVAVLCAACWGWRWWEGRPDPYLPSPLLTALSKAAEVYFKAIEKIGEQALQSSTSHVLGKALPLSICPAMSHSYVFLAFPLS